ncbi:MAG: hypothetical protein JO080_14635 [Mucilaginibacter sp.]|nr:hypothetical protein [Mucilaginibacter sp.]
MNASDTNSFNKSSPNTTKHDHEVFRLKNLDNLISALFVCKESYEYLAILTEFPWSRSVYMRYAADRANFAATLYINLSNYGGLSVDGEGNILGEPNSAWRKTSFDAETNDADSLLNSVISNELKAIKEYDNYLRNHIPVIKDLNLLVSQQNAIKQAISKI